MVWEIRLSKEARKQLQKLDQHIANQITVYLRNIAKEELPTVRGKGLTGNLTGYWRYRVGDFRIICEIESETITILVLKIGHRRDIY